MVEAIQEEATESRDRCRCEEVLMTSSQSLFYALAAPVLAVMYSVFALREDDIITQIFCAVLAVWFTACASAFWWLHWKLVEKEKVE